MKVDVNVSEAQCLIHGQESVHSNHSQEDVKDACHQDPGRTQNLTQMAPEMSMKRLLSGQG